MWKSIDVSLEMDTHKCQNQITICKENVELLKDLGEHDALNPL